jgi:hypothetical protein
MSGESPHADDSAERASQLPGLDDETLLAALREMFGPNHEAPGWFVDLATQSYGLRVTDGELAELTADSEAGLSRLLRAEDEPRLMSFEASGLIIEIEIQPGAHTGPSRLIGQLIPAGSARIHVRRAQEEDAFSVDADERGRFACENLIAGPLSLLIERQGHAPAATAWITIG